MKGVDICSGAAVEDDVPSYLLESSIRCPAFRTVGIALEGRFFLLERLAVFVHNNCVETHESWFCNAGLVYERFAGERFLAFLFNAVVAGAFPLKEVFARGKLALDFLWLDGKDHCFARFVVYRRLIGCSLQPCFLEHFRIGESAHRYKCGNNRYAYSFHSYF